MDIQFRKMHGLSNDFVVIDGRGGDVPPLPQSEIVRICDRRLGVGCDQLILLETPKGAQASVFMKIYNPDGSESGACGNATRCVADMLMRETGAESCTIQTIFGLLECGRADALVRVNMGIPRLDWKDIPLSKQCDTLHLPLTGDPVGVNVGNPHCVYFCANADEQSVDKIGEKTEHDPLFPQRTNVEFVSVLAPDTLRMRVWERGAGITPACGTGACASAIAAVRRGLTGNKVQVKLDGGDLTIEWAGEGHPVFMTGAVANVFEGAISLS